MSNIRVTYSGLIAFVIGIGSIFTGLLFVLIVTRRLSPEEFGTWAIIGSMISYFIISENIISYWTARQIARNEKVGKTSVFSSSFFSLMTIPIYFILVYSVSLTSNALLEPMLLGAILIPVFFISSTLMSINVGHKPHAVSYGLLVFEVFKIPAALALVIFLDLGLYGAILATLVGYIIRIIVQVHFAKQKIKEKFNVKTLRRWLKLSWIPLYMNITKFVTSTNVLAYTVITGSIIGVAYYTISLTVTQLVKHSTDIFQGLYPKLLSGGDYQYVKENFTLLMYFAIPLLGISVMFAEPAVFALNPAYQDIFQIAIILSFWMFFVIIRDFLNKVLEGTDKVDLEENPKFINLLKSKIFFVYTVNNIYSVVHLAILVPVLFILHSLEFSELELVTWWSIITLVLEIPVFIFMWIRVQKNIKFLFPSFEIAKYSGVTLAFVAIFLLTKDYIIQYHISIYDFLPGLFFELAICVGVYLGITYLIDKKTRSIFQAILKEFVQKN